MIDISTIKNIKTKQIPTVFRFCDLSNQKQIQNMIPSALFYGGYKNAERKRVYLFTDVLDDIICYKILYDKRYLHLTHKNILGTLMSLGITRDSIGDILVETEVIFVTKEISKEIELSFTKINSVPIQLTPINGNQIERVPNFSNHFVIVSSLRMDLVISKIAKVSRSYAMKMIQNGDVKVNFLLVFKPTRQLQENDILSLHKFGRFILDNVTNKTKKGNFILEFRKYE
jgi:RNA-binding protein YlmH